MNNALKLNDEMIAQIAKLVQIAILTGTDIIDNLRTLEVVAEDGELYLTPEYKKVFDNNLTSMMEEIKENSSATSDKETADISSNQQSFRFFIESDESDY